MRMTPSQQVIRTLQQKYGSANFQRWQSLRRQFYSFVNYADAGASEYRLFGDAVSGTVNKQLTNMPKAGSFGQNHFMLKAIRCAYFINTEKLTSYASTDATTLFTEFVNGVFQAGVLELTIGSRIMVQVPKPFLYMPSADGRAVVRSEGVRTLTLTEATPNTLLTFDTSLPNAQLNRNRDSLYLVDPNIVIEAEQNFQVAIRYPSGALPVTATTITSANLFYIGVIFDGLVFRPQQ